MLFEQFALSIRHFRFNPDTEFYMMLPGRRKQSFNTFRQFFFADFPITQTTVSTITGIFISKPAIVHDKQLSTHGRESFHHLIHPFLVHLEINTFPAIQQDVMQPFTPIHFILACPMMKSTTHPTFAIGTICHGKFRSDECLFRFQYVL